MILERGGVPLWRREEDRPKLPVDFRILDVTPNNVEGYIGGLKSFDGHQAEQAHLMLAIEVAKDKFSVDTIDDDSRWYDYSTRKLRQRQVLRRTKERT